MNASSSSTILQGTVDGLILKTLSWGPRHGYNIARWIRETSADTLNIEDRALYLALHRLEERGMLESTWGVSENNRKAKYYELTAAGRRELKAERLRLTEYMRSLIRVLDAPAWDPNT
ncbi:MAG: PadR family transcriptional regulator [Phycisphaerae bacterium]|nr:PadR family transcriptional regulator [Gemmatimonadaceae bacterium]